jgi:hypothetical protein
MVLVVGGLGLLFVACGLGVTAWLIFSGTSDKEPAEVQVASAESHAPGQSPPQPSAKDGIPPSNPGNNPPARNNPPAKKGKTPRVNPPPEVPPRDDLPPARPDRRGPPLAEGFNLKPEPGKPVKIDPVPFAASPMVAPLPGKVGDVQVGGGGRYLVMHFPDQKQLGVFDVSQAKLVRQMKDVPDDALIAAGLNRLAVVSSANRTLNAYTLPDLTPDGGGTPPNRGPVLAVAMGSATNGPLMVCTLGEISLFDLRTMARVEGSARFNPGAVPIHPSVQVRAAASGTMFTAYFPSGAHGPAGSYTERGGEWEVGDHGNVGLVMPAADGRTVFGTGQMFAPDGKALGPKVGGFGKAVWYVPAAHGDFFLRLNEKKEGTGFKAKQSLVVTVHAGRNPDRELISLGELPECDGLIDWRFGAPQPLDRFVFLVPDARTMAVIPPATRDRVILRKVNVK